MLNSFQHAIKAVQRIGGEKIYLVKNVSQLQYLDLTAVFNTGLSNSDILLVCFAVGQ